MESGKAFRLEAAKKGAPVQTRDGRKVRIICFDRKAYKPLVALITPVNELKGEEYVVYYNSYGKTNLNPDDDLLMR